MRKLILIVLVLSASVVFADKTHLAFFPEDVNSVYSFNVPISEKNDILGDDVIERADKFFKEFMENTGIDFREHAAWLSMGLSEMKEEDKEKAAGKEKGSQYIVLSGKFKQDGVLESLAEKFGDENTKGLEVETRHKYDIHYDGKKEFAICFVKKNLLLTGSLVEVQTMLDAYKRKLKSVIKKKEFSSVVPSISRNTVVWGILVNPDPGEEIELGSNPVANMMGGGGRRGGRMGFREMAMSDNMKPLEKAAGEYITLGFSVDDLGRLKKDGKTSEWSMLQMTMLFPGTKYVSETTAAVNAVKSSGNNTGLMNNGVARESSDPVIRFIQKADVSSHGTMIKVRYKTEIDDYEDLRDVVLPKVLPREGGRQARDDRNQVPPRVREMLKGWGISDEQIEEVWEEVKGLPPMEMRKKAEELIREMLREGDNKEEDDDRPDPDKAETF